MAAVRSPRRLIVNADDFGRSHATNQAVIRAHREGILTTASLMVNGPAAADAVALARQHPTLGVGLHLTLVCGTATLPPHSLPGLVDSQGRFSDHPVQAGFRYFACTQLHDQLRRELAAQFDRFHATELQLDHVNGHLHFHLHPTIFRLLMEHAESWNIRRLRLTRDPLGLNLRLARGHLAYRLSHALAFGWLARRAQPVLARRGIRHSDRVFGLLQNGRVNQTYVETLIASLPPGDSELYSHPSLDEFELEFKALISPRVREILAQRQIQRIRYLDL
jgi:chitin disaccharide deacetylase